ncbi:DUF3592 domain-containing protein [Tsukamurella paurometabola]|uniref:Protein of uncharacterized function (DUF3592) n=1 Tax=Tsukamurella paurometabola TaxID=2061 RepID=A0A3P8KQT6_TSUPA|nr:DUF3592 domain-containing protein [Tsukamurella paurometabola]UEA81640.1 DUF3592 domain-containing protein [Tsukamurella paurometabola]VDR38647.1 Protein of uncharacterised function (DUF3592) [Tsukamurella paurometabola]
MESQPQSPGRREAVRLARKSGGGVMAWLFIVVGIVWLVGSAAFSIQETVFWASARTVEGRVVDVESRVEHARTDSSTTGREVTRHQRVIEYQVDGHVHRFTERGSSTQDRSVGEQVTVRYSPGDPSRAALDNWGERWLPYLLVGGALLWLALWSGVLFWSRRERQRRVQLAMTGLELTATAGELTKSRSRNVDGDQQTSWEVEFRATHPTTHEQMRFNKTYGWWFKPRKVPPVGSTITVIVDADEHHKYILVDRATAG